MIVNETFVDQVLGGGNPIGRHVRRRIRRDEYGPWFEIVSRFVSTLSDDEQEGILGLNADQAYRLI